MPKCVPVSSECHAAKRSRRPETTALQRGLRLRGSWAPSFRASHLPYSLPALAAVISAAIAQEPPSLNYTSFDATSAAPLQLGYYGALHKDCSPAPLVTIRVSEPPRLGTFIIRPGQLTTSASALCPGLKIPAEVVFYQARAGATGKDHMVYEVINASSKVDAYDVTINIKEAPRSGAASKDKPI